MASYYQILGLAPDADQTEVEHAFVRLRQSLASQDFENDEKGKAQARKCLDAFEKAYETLKDSKKRNEYDSNLKGENAAGHDANKKPRLGQLCVASGIITVEQLAEAVEEQINSGLPLGEVLENLHFLSRAQLEGLLLGQDLIDLDDVDEDALAARVIALGLINEDMVLIAQMETRAQGVSLKNALVRRGWISGRLLEVL